MFSGTFLGSPRILRRAAFEWTHHKVVFNEAQSVKIFTQQWRLIKMPMTKSVATHETFRRQNSGATKVCDTHGGLKQQTFSSFCAWCRLIVWDYEFADLIHDVKLEFHVLCIWSWLIVKNSEFLSLAHCGTLGIHLFCTWYQLICVGFWIHRLIPVCSLVSYLLPANSFKLEFMSLVSEENIWYSWVLYLMLVDEVGLGIFECSPWRVHLRFEGLYLMSTDCVEYKIFEFRATRNCEFSWPV